MRHHAVALVRVRPRTTQNCVLKATIRNLANTIEHRMKRGIVKMKKICRMKVAFLQSLDRVQAFTDSVRSQL